MIRALDVTNVLSALEHPERQARQEVPGREQSGRGSQGEPCVLLQELAHLLQLRYTVRLEYLLLLHLLKISSILRASVFRHQIDKGVEHPCPSLGLRLRVRDGGYRVPVLVRERNFSDELSTGTVLLVSESGMIHVEVRLEFGHQVVAIVEVGRVPREPWILDADGVVREEGDAVQGGTLAEIPDQLEQVLPRHVDLDEHVELEALLLGRPRLDVGHRPFEVLDRLQDPRQGTDPLSQTQDKRSFLHRVLALRAFRYCLRQHHFLLGQSSV